MNLTLESATQRLTLSTNYGTPAAQGPIGPQGPAGPPGADGSGNSQFTAAQVISALRVIKLDSANQAVYADPSSVGIVGLSLEAGNIGDLVRVAGDGAVVSDPSWNWTPDAFIFCSTNGVLTQTAPTVGTWAPVGVALTATRIIVRPLTSVSL